MNVILYAKTGCPWCNGVRDYMNEAKISFEEKNVTDSKELFDEMVALSGQSKAPVVVIDGHMLADTDRQALHAYLEENKLI